MQQLQAELDSTEHHSCNGAQQPPEASGGSPNMQELLQLRRLISAYQVSSLDNAFHLVLACLDLFTKAYQASWTAVPDVVQFYDAGYVAFPGTL